MDKAWGAYSAAQLHDLTFADALIAQLHGVESLRDSPPDSEGYACIQSLLDTLIQLRAEVPTQAILPYATRWRAEALILLAFRTTDADEAALLAMREQNLNEAEWLAVNNLLLRLRSAAFFARTLQEIHITHTFVVSDTGEPLGKGSGGDFGQGSGPKLGFPKGFPPIAVYQLEIGPEWGTPPPAAAALPLIQGPMNQGGVFYLRTLIPAGGSAYKRGPNFRDTDRQKYRLAYMAELGGLPMAQVYQLFWPTTNIRWRSSADFAQEFDGAMRSQEDGLRKFAAEAAKKGYGSVGGMRLYIHAVIEDQRRAPDSSLPPPSTREIQLD